MRNNRHEVTLYQIGAKVMGFMNAKQLDAIWHNWCEYRLANCKLGSTSAERPADPAQERQLVRKLLTRAQNGAEQAVWLRSLVELCGLTIRQVSTYFNIEPQVVVQAISLLNLPTGVVNRAESTPTKQRSQAA